MQDLSLPIAIIATIKSYMEKGESFSVHDITARLRNEDFKTICLSDLPITSYDGGQTFVHEIAHGRVVGYFEQILKIKLFPELHFWAKKNTNGQSYREFYVAQNKITKEASRKTQWTNTTTDNYAPKFLDKVVSLPLIEKYLRAKGSATLKQIQSRLKGRAKLKCSEIKSILEPNGYRFTNNGEPLCRTLVSPL